ncbi:MAG: cyanophycin synthetase [bacterium]|nr:cyanophycin synthetase [bacterium]
MIKKFKHIFYFPIASYFKLFAQIQLSFWRPRIIVVTGSSGKTTLLHLIESQLGGKARYSHRANSSYGIPFDILGLERKKLTADEWLYLFLAAPFKAFKKPFKERIYVVEADCDRPGEGKFLASLLKPEVTIWLSCDRSHCAQFDSIVRQGKFSRVEEAIAQEFGSFLRATKSLVIVDDSSLIGGQLGSLTVRVEKITQKSLEDYEIFADHAEFKINGKKYQLHNLLPKDTFYSISSIEILMDYLEIGIDRSFASFYLPPGRSAVFKGIKKTTIIDSSYNSTRKALEIMLEMFGLYPSKVKWIVLGDILEQGDEEQEEHEAIADIVSKINPEQVILVGPRLSKYTYPKLTSLDSIKVVKFEMPKEALDYLEKNIKGGETIFFKGARFLEGIIEHLLLDKKDTQKLCRREKIWQVRRKQWGL